MGKINVLEKSVAELIAAGEVVTRPSSVVKELLENAIDAGASVVTVEIKRGGVSFIRITDDGCGIERDDVRTAFKNHATSKLKSGEDLEKILTLGFRGEALSSISAVSRVELFTKSENDANGTRYEIAGGEEISLDDAGCPDGTTIIVRDLFYNTPARREFLKKDSTEANNVADVVNKIALSHPEVKIRFISDGKQLMLTPGDGSLMSAAAAVLGKDAEKEFLECGYSGEFMSVKGLVSRSSFSRPTRSRQYLFVNGRSVRLPLLASALDNAFRGSIMTGKYPSCVLFITVDPRLVDVNVHPQKTEVRFKNENEVYSLIYYAVQGALADENSEVRRSLEEDGRRRKSFEAGSEIDQSSFGQPSGETVPAEKSSSKTDVSDILSQINNGAPISSEIYPRKQTVSFTPGQKNYYQPENHGSSTLDVEFSKELSTSRNDFDNKNIEYDLFSSRRQAVINDPSRIDYSAGEDEPGLLPEIDVKEEKSVTPEEQPQSAKANEEPFRVIGEAFGVYVIVQTEKHLYCIDKHAAHERIIYNRLVSRERDNYSQLMLPQRVSLDMREYDALLNNLDVLSQAGYDVQDFGAGSVVVCACPVELSGEDINSVIAELAQRFLNHSRDALNEKLDWLYHSTACRAAIKANDASSPAELEQLARDVLFDDNVRHCPHGRPVLMEISKYELDKMFGRIQ